MDAFGPPRAQAILGVVIVFSLTSTASLVLRFVGKRIKGTRVTAEDWFIIAAQVAVYGLAVVSILEVVLGNAGHHADEDPSKVPEALKLLIAVQVLYATSLALIKISICLFYNRIFPFRTFHIISWSVIALTSAWAAAAIVYAFLICRPLKSFWSPSNSDEHCMNDSNAPWVVFGAVDIFSNVLMLAMPIPLIWNLRVEIADKLALICIFGAGVSTMIVSVLRIEALTRVSFADATYTGALPILWTFVEPAMSISVACAPMQRPIVRARNVQADIPVRRASYQFHRIEDPLATFPSIIAHNGFLKQTKRRGSDVTTQLLESGRWSG